MVKKFLVVSLCLLLCSFYSCGRKGPLQEPLPLTPQKVTDFRANQKGNCLYFFWTSPRSYLDGQPVEIRRVEIRGMELKNEPSSEREAASSFEKFSLPAEELGIGTLNIARETAALTLDLKKAEGKSYLFGLRTRGRRGGWSDISNLIRVRVCRPPSPPHGLKSSINKEAVIITWDPPLRLEGNTARGEVFYNVYRSEGDEYKLMNDRPLAERAFADRSFSFGRSYRYTVRSLVLQESDWVESEDSEILEVCPLDTFPPAAPEEVRAVCGTGGVVLSWLPNQESDLAGYRVYRLREGQTAPILLTSELLTVTVFLDRSVEKNAVYVYSICAVDQAGNESQPAKIEVRT